MRQPFLKGRKGRMGEVLWKLLVRVLRTGAILFLLIAVWLWFAQERMIYFPRKYDTVPTGLVEIVSHTSQGRQVAFYLPCSDAPPTRLWVLFSGNGGLSLDWLPFVLRHRDPNPKAGYLFVDYPSYGKSEGRPTPSTILESTEAAWGELGKTLTLSPEEMNRRASVVGHSLGTAAALQFAAAHPVRQVILLAPFTTMRQMARRTVGWPLHWLCRHPFDNEARLAELAAQSSPPRVSIFHGANDTTIPISMSRALRDQFAPMVELQEFPDADHNDILDASEEALAALMQ